MQGALAAAGVTRVGYGLEVGRSVPTAGGAEAYCVSTRTAYFNIYLPWSTRWAEEVWCESTS